ncbi:hypothetical protein PAMA_001514 [Pampus argenteus]
MFLQKMMLYFSTACLFCYLVGFNFVLRIMHFMSPSFTKKCILKMGEKITMTQNPKFKYEDWGPTFKSSSLIKTASRHMWLSLGQEAFVGGEAPDSLVVTMEGEKTSICKFLKDGWAFTNNFDISQHRSLEERLSAARIVVQKEPLCPVVVDEMNDVTTIKYGALPERLYVVQAGKVVYKGGMGPWGYSPQEVRLFLEKMK